MSNIPGLIISENANSALSKGVAVTFASGGVALTALNAKKIVGVVTEDVAIDMTASVQVNGLAYAKLGGTVTAGMALAVTAAGLFVDASTNPVVAIARKAGVSGDLIEVSL
jgi:3-deoxy-D-manno-octulosonic acid (KDO) 8-phosphate synthase